MRRGVVARRKSMDTARALVSACLLVGLLAGTALAVSIETVPVGNPGNAADTRYATPGYGAVAYTYRIGKYEVTAGQYCECLNAVAKTDTYGLYNTRMWSSPYGCKIDRAGSSGNYGYSVAPDWANRPVNYVSYWDACRFTNWLHNGQPTGAQGAGTTETGAYTLNGYNADDGQTILRNVGWKWAVPSEDEWYKAAYHKNDGVTGNYSDYPTSSDSTPSNQLIDPDPGNNATYQTSGYTIGPPYYRTAVGAHESSDSPYGTFDQGGNVWEWNEAIVAEQVYQSVTYVYRGVRGGAFSIPSSALHASFRISGLSSLENFYGNEGFRVVEASDSDNDGVPDSDDNCPDTANSDQANADQDGVGDACDACPLDPLNDADGDGVCGDQDTCANSDSTATIVIDGCDTSVANALLPDGCTMTDKIAELASSARNHGEFVSGVARLTNGWKNKGLITGQEKGRIQKCAAQAAIPGSE
jgi:formylglycine-generating enzyme